MRVGQRLLTFDELEGTNEKSVPLRAGYGGVRWTNGFVVNAMRTSEYRRAVVSMSNVVHTLGAGGALV